MSDLLEYVAYQNNTCEDVPFNEVDGLVLSELSYVRWENGGLNVNGGNSLSLQEAIENLETSDYWDNLGKSNPNMQNMLLEIKDNPRYSNMVLSDYAEVSHTYAETGNYDTVEQFAAVTITYEDYGKDQAQHFISYRGTDGTLEGWHENTNMFYTYGTPAQIDAKDYMNMIAEKYPGDLIPGGHSKGGNLSMYSFLESDPKYKSRIKGIYAYDSPGFIDDAKKNAYYKDMLKLMEDKSFAPYDAVVGELLNEADYSFVATSGKPMVLDHDGFCWVIDVSTGQFVRKEQDMFAKALDDMLDTTLDDFLGLPENVRKVIVCEFWDIILNGDYENFDEVLSDIKNIGWELAKRIVFSDVLDFFEKKQILDTLLYSVPIGMWTLIKEQTKQDFEDLMQYAKDFYDYICQKGKDFADWTKEKYESFKSFVGDAYNNAKKKLSDWYNRNFSKSYQYASSHPQIIVGSDAMRQYAASTERLQRKIAQLESRIRSLKQDDWILMGATIGSIPFWGTGKRWSGIQNYLYDTATSFEKLEAKLINEQP